MTPTDDSQTPHGGLPHLVSACVHCHEVVGLPEDYATGDSLVCPLCEKPIAPEEIKPRTLRMAFHSQASEEPKPPPRPQPELPTSDSLKEWLEHSTSQMGFSDSVLDPTPSEHAREEDTEVESSLSGVELGSMFPEEKLSTPEAHEQAPQLEEASSSHDEHDDSIDPPEQQAETVLPEETLRDATEEHSAKEQSVEEDAVEQVDAEHAERWYPEQIESSPVGDVSEAEQIGPFEEEIPAAAEGEISTEDATERLGAEMTAQLLQAGSNEQPAKRFLLPVAIVLLVAIGSPIAYFIFSLTSGGSVPDQNTLASDRSESFPEGFDDQDLDQIFGDNEQEAASGVSQASFEQAIAAEEKTAEAEKTSTENSRLIYGDRYAKQKPARIILLGAPTYSYKELFDATSKARDSGRSFTKGSIDDPDTVDDLGMHYAHLCYLAQVITLIDPDETHSDLQMAKLEAVDVFKRVLRTERMRQTATEIAGPWLEWTGRPHGGVFFVGVPTVATTAGSVFEYKFNVAGTDVSVLTAEPISVRRFAVNTTARTVGIIGVVVEDPATHVSGYTGDADRAVWVQKTLALADPNEL